MKSQRPHVIVIPIYKKELSKSEEKSLAQCIRIFYNRKIVLAAPENLNLDSYIKHKNDLEIVRFQDVFFKNVEGYNKLLLSTHFYKKFSDYNYMLIYQLDAYVFKDELDYWCGKGYDYIGAPILEDAFVRSWLTHLKKRNLMIKLGLIKNVNVGNGGFSLRKISSFIFNSRFFNRAASTWNLNEDLFWSFRLPVLNPFFRIPSMKTAVQFAFEENPSYCYNLNNHQLPFGCHAWEKYDPEFWKTYI